MNRELALALFWASLRSLRQARKPAASLDIAIKRLIEAMLLTPMVRAGLWCKEETKL